MDIFIRALTASIEDIDADPEAYLRTAMDKIVKSYGNENKKESEIKDFLLPQARFNRLWAYGHVDE